MQEDGCEPRNVADIIADDKRRYIICLHDKGNTKKTLAYQLRVEDSFGVGWFRSFKHGISAGQTIKFTSKSPRKLTPEQKEEWRARVAAAKKASEQREKQRRERQARAAKRIQKALNNLPRAEEHPYLTAKKVQAHGLRLRRGELVMPIYQPDGPPWSFQRITADGGKWFFRGGVVAGGYFPLCDKGESLDTIIIAEGFSTSATIRETLKLPVVCALNAGNLKKVAMNMRAKYPTAKIVIAGDHDRFTKNSKGEPWNPGLEKAQQAAGAVGGFVVYPEFQESDGKLTDWNDYINAHGDEQLRDKMQRVLKTPEAGEDGIGPQGVVSGVDDDHPPSPEYDHAPPEHDTAAALRGDFRMQFRVLGYNERVFYYFPFKSRQIVGLSSAGHTMNALLELDDLDSWWTYFGTMDSPSPSKISLAAANGLMQTAKTRGVFKQEDRVRGGGAWMDEGRLIMHCGDSLYIDGQKHSFNDLDSYYTYVASAKLLSPADIPLDNHESFRLRKICEAISWENPLSGSLLAGWLVIAPLCAALEYRPHIYVTGESQSGKSTLINKIIKPILGKFALRVGGKTSEPSVREQMGYDARPLIFDEAEPSGSIGAVIELARMASTGEIVKKFGQNPFNARFCACFSAINPPVNKTADENRISFMVIKKNRKPTAIQDYDDLVAMIKETITPDFGARLVKRTLNNVDALFKNIEVFSRAFRKTFGDARASEQIGTMLAGLYLLGRTSVVTEEIAIEWVKRYEWTDHTIIDQEGDPLRLVQHIASSLVRYNGGSEISVAELISLVHRDRDMNSDKILRNYGIAVRGEHVSIASRSHNLARLLKDTEWSSKWSRTLGDVAGAEKIASEYFGRGIKTSGVRLPIELFIGEEEKIEDYLQHDEQELVF